MKSIQFLFYAVVAGVVALTSCAEETTEDYDKFESQSLEAYITQNKPELLANFQPVGKSGYYVEVIEEGNKDASPIGAGDMWLSYNFSGRSLDGSIVLTRNADEAKLLNTFTRYPHYVPFYRYCGADGADIQEGVYLAMRNELSLDNGARKIKLREGSKVVLYLPSLLVGSNGLEGSGGYEGETSLASGRPLRVELEICDTVKNPLELEGSQVDYFCEENGGREEPKKNDSENSSTEKEQLAPTDPKHPYNLANRWVIAKDSIAQLYVNLRYDPAKDRLKFPESDRYKMSPYAVAPYNDAAGLEEKIAQALVKRFHSDEAYSGVAALDADSVGLNKTAKIWYIGRFLDGFIFDTNINEVKELIYGSGYTAGEAIEYIPSSGGLISAFYYTIPNLKFGQWATFITTSTNGYGSAGQNGISSTSSSGGVSADYYDYLNYLSYYNSYYNNYYSGYYGGYYGGYGGYYGGYYDDYYGGYYDSAITTTTTTTVTTEIPSYCPLIFQIYIEPDNSTDENY